MSKLSRALSGKNPNTNKEGINVKVLKVFSNDHAKFYDAVEENNVVSIPELNEKYNVPEDVSSFWMDKIEGFRIRSFKYYMAFHGIAELASWNKAIKRSRKGITITGNNGNDIRVMGNAEEIFKLQDIAALNQLVSANIAPSKSMSFVMIIIGIIIGYIVCDSGLLAGMI